MAHTAGRNYSNRSPVSRRVRPDAWSTTDSDVHEITSGSINPDNGESSLRRLIFEDSSTPSGRRPRGERHLNNETLLRRAGRRDHANRRGQQRRVRRRDDRYHRTRGLRRGGDVLPRHGEPSRGRAVLHRVRSVRPRFGPSKRRVCPRRRNRTL